MNTQTCGNCRFRGDEMLDGDKPTGYFPCGRIKHDGDKWDEHKPGAGAVVVDGSGYFAALCVESDFGCNRWEANAPDAGKRVAKMSKDTAHSVRDYARRLLDDTKLSKGANMLTRYAALLERIERAETVVIPTEFSAEGGGFGSKRMLLVDAMESEGK